MNIKYKNPPINELVIGVYFDRPVQTLRSEHVGLFWSSVRTKFPSIGQQPMITPPVFGGSGFAIEWTGQNEVYPMPRFWLEGLDGSTVIQIQKSAFLFNWRKRESDYPHYETVKAAFDENFARFSRFLQKEVQAQPALQIAELNYINVIESCEYWRGPQDTANVFPNFRMIISPESEALRPIEFNQVTTQQVAPDLSLTTSIRNGRSILGSRDPVLVFEFRALGLLGAADKAEADAWFDRAHETIGNCFTTVTNPDIQRRYWQSV
jgi:uncharacterized protein (TIGR04255 family)